MLNLLKKLTDITAPSGSESLLFDVIKSEIEPYVDEIYTDALGNLTAHKKGNGKKVMFSAHMDEIGLIATFITDEGFVRTAPIGGVNPYYALSARVRFTNGTLGVVWADLSEKNELKNLKIGDLYIDIGARSKKEAEEIISVGDTAGFLGDYFEAGHSVVSKSLDNRAGCAVLIQAIKNIKKYENDLYFVFSYGEELGLRGAKTAAYAINPDFAVAIDVTRTGDSLDKTKMAVSLGGGAAIKVKDNSVMCHPYIKTLMQKTAEKYGIKYQTEVLERGGTDAGAIHISRGGVITGAVSVPTRYIHSISETADINDLKACAELAEKLIEEGFKMQ